MFIGAAVSTSLIFLAVPKRYRFASKLGVCVPDSCVGLERNAIEKIGTKRKNETGRNGSGRSSSRRRLWDYDVGKSSCRDGLPLLSCGGGRES